MPLIPLNGETNYQCVKQISGVVGKQEKRLLRRRLLQPRRRQTELKNLFDANVVNVDVVMRDVGKRNRESLAKPQTKQHFKVKVFVKNQSRFASEADHGRGLGADSDHERSLDFENDEERKSDIPIFSILS